ncbi:MAG: response regulator [Chloroflexi bacterium]|nr:response regulator [Chloroflexota bacterium]
MPTKAQRMKTIAVLVEHEITRRLISHVLEEEGFVVLQIDAASVGTDHLVPGHPDVIVLDAQLSVANSYALCRDFSSSPTLRGTRIVMFGHKCTSVERLAGLRAGADEFISGPFDYAELLARIEKYWR